MRMELREFLVAWGRVDIVELLAAQVHDRGPNGATPLHFASTVAVAERLLAHGTRLDTFDKHGRPPAQSVAGDIDLARAVALDELAEVRRLFDPGATVLPDAALHGHIAIVEFLLANGADPNAGFPLHRAARNSHVDAARLLLEHGADPRLLDEWHQSTPLGWAEFQGREEIAEFLRTQLK
ncbi:MAG: ankyrin repeat domain-containing protein [Bryobacteraceae bacterium]